MQIRGTVSPRVELEGGKVGDSVSIHLSEDPTSPALWLLRVYVKTVQGLFLLGEVITVPPNLGGPNVRTVAIASCPGAIGWQVEAKSLSGEAVVGELVLVSSECCGERPGVVAVGQAAFCDPSGAMAPAYDFTAATFSDTVNLVRPARGLIVSGRGTITLVSLRGSVRTFADGELSFGVIHWMGLRRINNSGTTIPSSAVTLIY
jgi:hypothetical protein